MNILNVTLNWLKDLYIHVIEFISVHPHATLWIALATLAIAAWL